MRLFDARLDYGPRDGSRKFAAWAAETARDARPKAVGFKWMLSQQFGEAFEAWRVGGAGAARRPERRPRRFATLALSKRVRLVFLKRDSPCGTQIFNPTSICA